MFRRSIFLACLILEPGLINAAEGSLVGWWKSDEPSGTIAHDSSGYGNHGILHGGMQLEGGGLEFDGLDDCVDCGDGPSLNITGGVTVTAWIRLKEPGADRKIAGNQDGITGGYKLGVYSDLLEFEIRTANNVAILSRNVGGGMILEPGVYHHVAGVYSSRGNYIRTYVDGVLDRELSTTSVLGTSTGNFIIGREPFSDLYFWLGFMEDVRVYNRALTQDEIHAIALGEESPFASNPTPGDGAIISDTWVTLTWTGGADAVSHDVYFSDYFDDVSAGTEAAFQGNVTETILIADFPGFPYPDGPVPGTTYYWRIDEINDANPDSPWKGDVWKFTIRPPFSAWWRFDENQGSVANDSEGSAHATIAGASWTSGRTGEALYFDGVDDVVVTPVDIDQGEQSTGITLCAWVYPDSIQPGRHQVISSDDGGYDWSILCENDGNWHVFTGDDSEDTGFTVDIGQWQFVAAVFEPATGISFHKNDGEVLFHSIYYDFSSNNIAIGDNPGPWSEFFAGKIDEVRVYKRALSSFEITNLFGRSEGNVDLDVDSDNNSVFNLPDRSLNEDIMEDDPCQPGRIVVKNNDDNDGDQIPDFADGFNLDGIWGNKDDLCRSQRFVPIVAEIADHIDLEQARVRVTYYESVPADTSILPGEPNEYVPAPGTLRIWTQPGDVQRNSEHVGRGGDFVIPSVYSPAQLGFTSSNRSVTWYVEGIEKSWARADQEIMVEVDPDGPGPAVYAGDIVRLTTIDMRFMTEGPDAEMIDQEFTYNCVPAPRIHATVEDCQVDESGLVTMTISGTVTDQTSGIVSDPSLQLQNITISPDNQTAYAIDLVNTGEPEYPWQPYKFQSNFSATVQLQTHPVHQEYQVFLRTSENPAGIAAELSICVFCNGQDVQYVREAENDPGTYLPTIVRIAAPEGTFTEGEATIRAFENDWSLQAQGFGNGNDFYYATDKNDNVAVFLPALYPIPVLDPDIPIKLVTDVDFDAKLKKGGYAVAGKDIPKIYGLRVNNDDVSTLLNKITNYSKSVFSQGGVKTYVYQPKTGWAGRLNNDDSLDTEIKWRYINHADTVSGSFESKKHFEDIVEARKETVKAARDVTDWKLAKWSYTMACPDCAHMWARREGKTCPQCKPNIVYGNAYWTDGATVKAGTACAAIADAFNNQKMYDMGCYMAAILVMEHGMCLSLTNPTKLNEFNALLGSNPFGWEPGKLYSKVITREMATGGSKLLTDKVKWIPGDWGYIKNWDPKDWWRLCTNVSCKNSKDDPTTSAKEGGWPDEYQSYPNCPLCNSPGKLVGFQQGENIIYLGGSAQGKGNFDLNYANFKGNAYFWGLGGGEHTLQQWVDAVNTWRDTKVPPKPQYETEIKDFRDRIKY
jgi:hypothetical protein